MALRCDRCGADIPPSGINPELLLASCPACENIVQLGAIGTAAPPAGLAPTIPRPESVTVDEAGGRLVLEHSWWGLQSIFLLVFAMFWNGFLLFWYTIALTSGDLMMLVFPLLHVAAGIAVGYTGLAGLFNRTTVTVADGRLAVRHGPLPWPGNRDLSASALRQLHCERHVAKTKNGTTTTWSVEATLDDGRSLRLLSGLDELAKARYYEKMIEAFLGIADRRVPGEAAPS